MPEVDDWVTPTAAGPPPEPVDDWVTPKSTAAHDDWITPEPEKPEAEGILSTFGRSFAHEAPAVVAGAAGALYGGALGAPAGPVGAIGGALVGGFAGGYAGGAIGEQAYKAVGVDDAIQRAINAKTNPWSAAAGQAAAQILGFGAGAASGATRLAGAGIGAALEGGSQAYEGEFSPARLATQAVAGAAFTKPYGWGERIEQAGVRAAERIRPPEYGPRQPEGPPEFQGPRQPYGPPEQYGPRQEPDLDYHGSGNPKSSGGVSESPMPPPKDVDIGLARDNKVTEDDGRGYAKDVRPKLDDGSSQVHVTDTDPDIQHVLDQRAVEEYGPNQPQGPRQPEGPPEFQGPRQPYGPPEMQGPLKPLPVAEPPQGVTDRPAPAGPTKLPAKGVDPNSLNALDYLTTQGGLKADEFGELASIRGGGGNYNYPQGGALFRKEGGMTLDQARQKLVDAGFINDEGARMGDRPSTSTTNDVLDIVRDGLGGQHTYTMGNEGRQSTAQKARLADENLEHTYRQVDDFLDEVGVTDPEPGLRDRMVKLMQKGLDVETAHDRVMEEPAPKAETGGNGRKPVSALPFESEPVGRGTEIRMKAAGNRFSAELDKAEKAAEQAGKSRDDYHDFLSEEGKAALREHTKLAEQVDEAKFNDNYKKLNDILPEGYTATREKSQRQYGDERWQELEGTRHDRNFDVRDPNGEVVGSISGVHLFERDLKNGWAADLLKTGHAEPVMQKAMREAREASGVPEGVTDLNFERARPALQEVADELSDASHRPTGKVEVFPSKPTYERGVEGKDQAVIPGAEQIGQGELAQRASDRGLQAKVPQKGPNEGFMERLPDELFARRDVLERGRSGRPIRTEKLPIGSEEGIIKAGLEKVENTPRPEIDAERTTEAMARKGMSKEEMAAAAKLAEGKPVTKVEPSRRLQGKKLTGADLVAGERGDIAPPTVGEQLQTKNKLSQHLDDIEARIKKGDYDANLAPTGTTLPEFKAAAEARGWTEAPYGKGKALWSPDRKHVMFADVSVEGNSPQVQWGTPGEGVKAPPTNRIDMSKAEREMLRPKASDTPPEMPDRLTKAGFEVGRAQDGTWVLTQDGIYRGHADNAAQLVKQANAQPANKPNWKDTIPFASAKKDGVTDFDLALTRPRKAEDLAAAESKTAASLRDMFTNNSNKKKFDELSVEKSETGDLVRNLVAEHERASKTLIDAGVLPGDHDKIRGNPELEKAASDLSNIAGGLNRFLNGVARKNTAERRAKDLEGLRSDLAAAKGALEKPAADPINAASDKILKDMGITPDEKGGTRDIIGEKDFDKAAVAGEKIKGEGEASKATGKKGDFYIEKDDAKPGWVVKKGDEVISEHANKGQAYIGLHKAAAGAAPGTPAGLSPTGGQAIPPNVGAAVRQGGAGGLAPTPPAGAGPPPPPPPGGGGGGPNQPNAGHVPPQQRGWFSELWRDVQRKVGAHMLGPEAMEARRLIRGSYGENYRVAEQTAAMLKDHQETIRAMDPADRAALINQMQGGNHFPNFVPTAEQKALMQTHERVVQEWEAKLRSLPEADKMNFIDHYMAGMYENPNAAPNMFAGAGKRGGAGSTKGKVYATYEDAKAAGLIPKTDDPIEITTRYINSIKDFVASRQVLDRAELGGNIGYFKATQNVGATGSPTPLQKGGPPPGWKQLNGVEKNGKSGYAPEDFADAYNNFYDKGFGKTDKSRNVYEAVRNSTNAWTQLELGLNAYHMFTMANEAIISDVGTALSQLFKKDYAGAGATLKDAWRAPYRQYVEGKIKQKEYLDPNSTNPIASILAEANARPIGRGHAADYTFQDRGSFINKFDKNSIQSELNQAWKDIKGDFANAPGVGDKAMAAFRNAGRAMQTVAAPIFDKYIPALKYGALNSMMEKYHAAMLKENPNFDMINNPADRRTAVNAAMKMVDSVDNRFGEMIHDNMFMNATLKQSAQVGMRSFSWAIGAMKEIGGGTAATGKNLVSLARTGENRFSMTHPEWDPRMSYAIAFPMVVSTISAIYQGLFAGEKPSGWRDLYAPKTGGTVPGVGGRGQVPEHVLMPGYQKDVLGWTHHPLQEAYNKLGGLPQTAIEQATGKDWRGQAIVRPNASVMEAASDRMGHLFSKLGPISIKNMVKGTEPTSHISKVETALGFRAPGALIQDPEGLERAMKFKEKRAYDSEQKRQRKTELRQLPP